MAESGHDVRAAIPAGALPTSAMAKHDAFISYSHAAEGSRPREWSRVADLYTYAFNHAVRAVGL